MKNFSDGQHEVRGIEAEKKPDLLTNLPGAGLVLELPPDRAPRHWLEYISINYQNVRCISDKLKTISWALLMPADTQAFQVISAHMPVLQRNSQDTSLTR